MCMKTPDPPKIEKPPPPPTVTAESAQMQAEQERRRRAQASGRASTVLSVPSARAATGKTLLGS